MHAWLQMIPESACPVDRRFQLNSICGVAVQVSHSCGDLIFSSHTTFALSGALTYTEYGSLRACKVGCQQQFGCCLAKCDLHMVSGSTPSFLISAACNRQGAHAQLTSCLAHRCSGLMKHAHIDHHHRRQPSEYHHAMLSQV